MNEPEKQDLMEHLALIEEAIDAGEGCAEDVEELRELRDDLCGEPEALERIAAALKRLDTGAIRSRLAASNQNAVTAKRHDEERARALRRQRAEALTERSPKTCPLCGAGMVVRFQRRAPHGAFWGCERNRGRVGCQGTRELSAEERAEVDALAYP